MSIPRFFKTHWALLVGGTFAGIALGGLSIYHQRQSAKVAEVYSAEGEHCDRGIGAAKGYMGSGSSSARAGAPVSADDLHSNWIPKINDSKPPGPAPAGMIWMPGGRSEE